MFIGGGRERDETIGAVGAREGREGARENSGRGRGMRGGFQVRSGRSLRGAYPWKDARANLDDPGGKLAHDGVDAVARPRVDLRLHVIDRLLGGDHAWHEHALELDGLAVEYCEANVTHVNH